MLIADVNIYPNPVKDNLFFNMGTNIDEVKAEVYNLVGLKIKESIIKKNRAIIDMTNIKAGNYLLKVFDIKGQIFKIIYLTKR